MRKIEIIVEKTTTGFSAYAVKYSVATTGKNLDELKSNIVEALNLFFNEKRKVISLSDIKITLDIPQFFEFYRLINAKAFSERIGMNQSLLAQYIRGIKKPSSDQANRILMEIKKVGRELTEIGFLV